MGSLDNSPLTIRSFPLKRPTGEADISTEARLRYEFIPAQHPSGSTDANEIETILYPSKGPRSFVELRLGGSEAKEHPVNRRKSTGIIASVALALLGSIVLFKVVSAKSESAAPIAAEPTVQVWVAARDIPKGTPAAQLQGAGLVVTKQVKTTDRQADAVGDLNVILDKVSADPIYLGDQILLGRFISSEKARSSSIEPGKISTTLILSADRIGGVQAGDTVGIIATFAPNGAIAAAPAGVTHLAMHKVPVLSLVPFGAAAVPTTVAGADPNAPLAAGQYAVTLAVEGPDAERLVFISQFGIVNLVNEPLEAGESNTKLVTFDNVYTPTPQSAVPVTTQPVPLAPPTTVAARPTTTVKAGAPASPTTTKPGK